MKSLDKSHCHVFFDPSLPPAIRVAPGEEVMIQTLDACYGQVRSLKDYLAYHRRQKPQGSDGNPLTGPVFIEGAKVGTTLVVHILNIELDDTGFQAIGPNRAIIRDELEECDCYLVRIENGQVSLSNGIRVPANPVIGTLGNAPAVGPTNLPNPLGGNIDVPQVRTGSKVYIPIEVNGAMFSLGDVHACQGDGEVVGAPEIGAKVTVRF